mgnify:CR=1 FL=1
MRSKSESIADLGRTAKINRASLVAVQQPGRVDKAATPLWSAVDTVLDSGPTIRDATLAGNWNGAVADTTNLGQTVRLGLVNAATLSGDLGTIDEITGDNVTLTGGVDATRFRAMDRGYFRWMEAEANGLNHISLKAPASVASSVDFVLPDADGTVGQVLKTDGSGNLGWVTVGDVVGPASATDNALARFDTTTGKLLQNSTVTVSDTGAIAGTQGILPAVTNASYLGGASNSWAGLYLIGRQIIVGAGTVTVPNTVGTLALLTDIPAGLSDGDKGDVTVSSSGAVWTIDAGAVTLAKQADMATASVVYRKTAGAGAPEVQTLATLKTDLGLTGTNSGDQDLSSYLTSAAAALAYQPLDADLTSWASVTRAAGFDTFAATALGATTTILVGGGVGSAPVWTTATGTGAAVRATSPTLVTPVLGAATGTSLDLVTGGGSISINAGQSVWLGGSGTGSRTRQNAGGSFVISSGGSDRITITAAGAVTIVQTLGVPGTTTLAACDATSIGATTPGTGAFTTLERKQGNASDTVKVGGRVHVNASSAASSSSAYANLMTHTLAASTLGSTGDSLHIKMAFNNNTTGAATAQWRASLDGDVIYESTATATDGEEWIEIDIYRTGTTAGSVFYRVGTPGGTVSATQSVNSISPSSWDNALVIKAEGKDSTSSGELVQTLLDITYMPANS